MITKRRILFALLACATASAAAQQPAPQAAPEFGPAHGTLMIIGGGLRSEALWKRFIGLAGGPEAFVAPIRQASGVFIVRRDRFEVVGSSYVLIYDNSRMIGSTGQFYFLAPGDHYNLKTREAERPEPKAVSLERVVKQPWKR